MSDLTVNPKSLALRHLTYHITDIYIFTYHTLYTDVTISAHPTLISLILLYASTAYPPPPTLPSPSPTTHITHPHHPNLITHCPHHHPGRARRGAEGAARGERTRSNCGATATTSGTHTHTHSLHTATLAPPTHTHTPLQDPEYRKSAEQAEFLEQNDPYKAPHHAHIHDAYTHTHAHTCITTPPHTQRHTGVLTI